MKLPGPALQYFGGKWLLAPWIISHMPAHTCYVEPYAGGASVLLRKPPSPIEVYNDLDHSVVNFFRVLRDRPDDLIRAIELTPFSREEADSAQAERNTSDPIESARRLVIRAYQVRGRRHTSSGWRYSLDVPHATAIKVWNALPERLASIVERLRLVQIENKPALQVITRFDAPTTLFYVDPPYLLETRQGSANGYAQEMHDDAEHQQLAAALNGIRGMAMVSGYEHSSYDRLYTGWRKLCVAADTRYSVDGETRVDARLEVLWLSPNIPINQPSLFDMDEL